VEKIVRRNEKGPGNEKGARTVGPGACSHKRITHLAVRVARYAL